MTLQEWWRGLRIAPEALTPRQRVWLVVASIVTAVTRVLALSRTPWDWDEILFMLALNHFDVARHRPHPPGFPLFIFSAKILRKFSLDNFHALQALNLLAAMAIMPAMFFLCRELRMRFSTSLSAALILAFFPNVWFFGGTAYSDVPSMTLIILAVALLLRGCRDSWAYLAGAAMLAIAGGFRPQNLMIGLVPLLMATVFQIWRSIGRVLAAAVIIVIIIGISYGTAAWLTGWSAYSESLRSHSDYITQTDSFRSPHRPPLWRVFDDFFVEPYHAPLVSTIVTLLVVICCVVALVKRRRPHVLAALAAFAPFCVFAWLMLDRYSASRFSIGYAPVMALLAADGLQIVTRRARIEAIACALILAVMILWAWPAIVPVRHGIAPPVAAVDWIRNHVDPRQSIIYVGPSLIPFPEWYLPEYHVVNETPPPAAWAHRLTGYYLDEGISNSAGSQNFMRPRGRLWNLVRRRYFEVTVRPVTELVTYGDGWYDEEGTETIVWRWMSKRSISILPPIKSPARLSLSLYVPLDVLHSTPTISILLNGTLVDRFIATTSDIDRQWLVNARSGAPNELVIETDRTVIPAIGKPGADGRALGLRLNSLGWMSE